MGEINVDSRRPLIPVVIAHREDAILDLKQNSSRLQFSLRTVLAVISIAAIGFTYLARQDAARRQLITDIENVGGTVRFDESITVSLFKSQRVSEVMIPHGRIADVGPMRLKSFPNLSTLGLEDVDSTNNGGVRFRCSELRLTNITDDILKGLESNTTNEE